MSNRCKPPEPSISLIIYNVGMAIAKAVGGFFPKLNAIVNVVEQGKNIYDTIKNGGKEGPDPILLDCMNRNFENIKANAQSIAQNAKLIDRNYQAVLQISRELQNAKNEILKSVEESTIKPILSDLKTFLSDFTTKSKELSLLNDDELITRLENPDGFMYFIKELIKSGKSGNFHARLNDIINLDLAIPENDKDSFKFIMLFLLVNSLSSYVSMLETLNAQYGKLIEQHFDHSEIKEYNKLLKFRYDMFKDIGTGLIASNTGLIDKVIAVLEKVASVPDFADKKDLLTELSVAQENFKKLKVVIANKIKSQFVEVPKRITVNPDFSKSKIKTPAKPSWIAKRKVSYAILYEDENTKKRTVVSRWSNPYRIGSKACPTVKIPLDPQRRTRIIYRKFHPDDDPKLVAIITAPNATSFVDIDRDVFNIAKETSEDAVEEIEPYVRHGANINAVFEKARTSLHVAAASGNLDLVRYLVEHGARADQFDRNGYTALHNAAWKGAVDFVEGAIAEGLMDANVLSYQSNTPLHSAVLGEHALVVDALLSFPQTDVTLKNYHGLNALHLAAVRGYEAIVELFLSTEFGAAQNAIINQPSDSGWTALHLAVANGRTTVVERLLEKKDRQGKSLLVNVAGQGGNTALHLAVQRKDPVLVRLLLSSGADVAAQTAAEHQTALHYAVAHYEPAVLRALLEAGAPVNQPDTLGQTVTPLYYALQHGLTDVVRLLLASCAKFDLLLVGGRTQLHLAAVKGDVAVLRGLIEQGADVNQKFYLHVEGEKVERQALDLALENGNVEVAEILIQNNAEVKFLFDWENSQMDSINKPLSRLHLNEDQSFQMVEMLKKAKKDYQATFTLFACRKGFLRLLNSLKDNDFDKRVISCAKNAIKFGQIEIIKNLKKIRSVKYKWSLNENDLELEFLNLFSLIKEPYVYFIKNNFDLSEKKLAELLHLAAKEGHYEMLKCTIDLLQEHFEKEHEIYSNKNFLVRQSMAGYLDALNNDGKSSLLLACEYNADTKIVEYLLNAGAKINLTESSGSSELYYAAKHGNLPSVKLLVANGAVVDQIHKNGYTPLATAIEGKGSFELVKYLEENGANLYLKVKTDTNEEITLANLALKADKIDVAEYLVKKKVQIIKAGFSHAEWTKLQEVAFKGSLSLVQMVLKENSTELKIEDDHGRDALHCALLKPSASNAFQKLEIIKLLLSAGGNVDSVDKEGMSLLHQAVQNDYTEIAMLLLQSGANFNTISNTLTTPFSTAVTKDNIVVAKMFLKKGLLRSVFDAKSVDMLQLLVSYGANPLERNKSGATFFEIAIQNDDEDAHFDHILRWYLFTFKTASGRTVAHEVQTPAALQYIASHGGNLNALDDRRETPLHVAVARGSSEIVRLLIELNHCVNVGARNADNETAIDVARRMKNLSGDVVQLLEKVRSEKRVKRNVRSSEVDGCSRWLDKLFLPNINKLSPVGKLSAGMAALWGTGSTADVDRQNFVSTEMNPFNPSSSPSPNIPINYTAVEVNSTLLLLDVMARKVTGQQYLSDQNVKPNQLDIRSYALNVTEQFGKTLQQIDEQFGYEQHSKVNNFELFKEIEALTSAEKWSKIELLLRDRLMSIYPQLEEKQVATRITNQFI